MKKRIFTAVLVLLVSMTTFGQGNSGLGFNYQAVVRGVDGFVLPKQSVELRFSLMPGQQSSEASWVESHNAMTDDFGIVSVVIGKGKREGGAKTTFANVDFASAKYWLKVDIKEGSNYRELSYTALASVPYAEAATNAVSSPVGSIMPFAGDASKVPTGWLLCDGREVSRSDYAALYAVIGTAWGYGNNSTTFRIPDLRGVFLRGVAGTWPAMDADAASRLPRHPGGNSGNNVGTYQDDAIRNITGTFDGNVNDGNAAKTGAFYNTGQAFSGSDGANGGGRIGFDASLVVPTGTDNRPKNVYVNYIIKY